MNIAQARPRSWTPHIILFSIVLHAVVIYYIAVAFKVVPPIIPTSDPPVIKTVTFTPPPPPVDQPDRVIEKRPRFQPRVTTPPPVDIVVQPTPLPPVVTPNNTNPPSLDVRTPIPEQPISQVLPSYPPGPLANGIEGRVRMSITIMPDGSVRDVRVLDARPRGQFDAAAVRAVQSWRYRPSGVIRTNVIVDMDFELRDG